MHTSCMMSWGRQHIPCEELKHGSGNTELNIAHKQDEPYRG